MDFPVIDAHIHPFIEPENNIAAAVGKDVN